MIFIAINSLILFFIMQVCGVPISNLAVLEQKYDTFKFSNDKTTSGVNIIYNVFLSNIYILFLNELSFSKPYVEKLYLIVVGYLLIRYIAIFFILQRGLLLNAKYELTLIGLVLLGTYLVFTQIINANISMRIPIEDFKNEIMLLLIIFLYDIFKNTLITSFESRDVTARRASYIRKKYSYFFNRYNPCILNNVNDDMNLNEDMRRKFILLIYSFIIYENFSRPKFYRIMEKTISKFSSKRFSTGVMQVKSRYSLSDEESIVLGIAILKNKVTEMGINNINDYWVQSIANEYNPSNDKQYAQEILYIYRELSSFTGMTSY